jgi:hypothetical protein
MRTSTSEQASHDRREDLDITEPDLWLEDFDLAPEGEQGGDAVDPAFYDAKTDPGRPIVDAFATTLPDGANALRGERRSPPDRAREEALASFLENVRRVFGKAPGAE